MKAQDYLARFVQEEIVPYCYVVAMSRRGLGATFRLKPDQDVPDDAEQDVYIQVLINDIPFAVLNTPEVEEVDNEALDSTFVDVAGTGDTSPEPVDETPVVDPEVKPKASTGMPAAKPQRAKPKK